MKSRRLVAALSLLSAGWLAWGTAARADDNTVVPSFTLLPVIEITSPPPAIATTPPARLINHTDHMVIDSATGLMIPPGFEMLGPAMEAPSNAYEAMLPVLIIDPSTDLYVALEQPRRSRSSTARMHLDPATGLMVPERNVAIGAATVNVSQREQLVRCIPGESFHIDPVTGLMVPCRPSNRTHR